MAGLIRISNEASWSVAGWVYDHVLRQSVPFIPVENRRLLSVLNKGMTEGLSYIDLNALSLADKQVFLYALKSGLRRTEESGSTSVADPSSYRGFIDRFRELVDMLSADLNESAESINNDGEI